MEDQCMIRPNRKAANILLQILSFCLLSLFLYSTYELQPLNILWFTLALLLGVIGYYRQLLTAVFFALSFVFIYGAFINYQLFTADVFVGPAWDQFIWLFVFPFMAIIGGINKEDRLPKLKGLTGDYHFHLIEEETQTPRSKTILDKSLQFHSY